MRAKPFSGKLNLFPVVDTLGKEKGRKRQRHTKNQVAESVESVELLYTHTHTVTV